VLELEGTAGYDIWPPQYEWSLRKRAECQQVKCE